MTRVKVFGSLVFLGSGLSSLASPQIIIRPILESQRVVLAGNTRPEVRPEFDRGPVKDSLVLEGMQLQLKHSPALERAAQALIESQQRAGSHQFHHWLTAEQYAEQFGAAVEDIAKVSDWLRSHGFKVSAPTPSHMVINFSGTAGQVRSAFQTEIHNLNVHGQKHIANDRDPSIPAALAPVVAGIVSLHDFRPNPTIRAKPAYTFSPGGSTVYSMVPSDLAIVYNLNPLYALGITGQGQTIAVIGNSDLYTQQDWDTFVSMMGSNLYPGGSLTTVHPGGCADPGVVASEAEASLDVEWASAAAPGATIQLASCADNDVLSGILISIQNLLNQNQVPPIVSLSFEECEATLGAGGNAAFNTAFQQAAMEGVSVFVAAGDSGGDICAANNPAGPVTDGLNVNAFASTAYNVAVGGTDFADSYLGAQSSYWATVDNVIYGSALSYVPEIPWNDTCASALNSSFQGFATPYGPDGYCASQPGGSFLIPTAGAGGPSSCAIWSSDGSTCQGYAKPAWQQVFGNPNDGVRDLPDVSMFAADGVWGHFYIYCNSDPDSPYGSPCIGIPSNWSTGGGTSFATPIMAGIQALVNQTWGGPQGNPAPIYYSLAQAEYGTQGQSACLSVATGGPASNCVFNDITLGDISLDCTGTNNCYAPPGDPGIIGVLSLDDNSYQPAFQATVGWDFASGIGSVNAYNLVTNNIWTGMVTPMAKP